MEDAQAEEAQADRANDTLENLLFKLSEFLTVLLLDLWTVPGLLHATEQAKALCEDKCYDIVDAKITQWADQGSNFYGERELLLHKRMWDIVTRDKDGTAKEQSFGKWCRRVALHSETISTARGHVQADKTATEHAEADTTASFRALAEDILTNDLTEAQLKNPLYKLREGKALTSKQRSTINAILRKNLGDARVSNFIFNNGIPTLLNEPREPPNKALLQNMLEAFMIWHASLLHSLLEREKHPDMTIARKLSDLDHRQWREERQQRKCEANQRLRQGRHLASQRDSRKRKCDDMSATEQQLLEDFETRKSEKQYEEARGPFKKLPYFHGKIL